MIKRPIFFTSLALALGVFLGFSLLLAENYAAKQIMNLLEGEVVGAGPYSFEYDSADISFLSFKGKARNARIIENGQVKVLVPVINASFGLGKIRQSIITLKELEFIGAKVDGILPDSPIFKVVDYICTPLPNSTAKFKIELLNLIVGPSQASESLGNLDLKGEGVQLELNREAENHYSLRSSARAINLHSKRSGLIPLPMAAISGFRTNLVFKNKSVEVQDLSAKFEGGQSYGNLILETAKENQVSGALTTRANHLSLGLSPNITGNFQLQSELSGTTNQPKINNIFNADNLNILEKIFDKQLNFAAIEAKIDFEKTLADWTLQLHSLIGEGENLSLNLEQPIILNRNGTNGAFSLSAKKLNTAYGELTNIKSKIILDNSESLKIHLSGDAPPSLPLQRIESECLYHSPSLHCSLQSLDKKLVANAQVLFRPSALPILENSSIQFKYSAESASEQERFGIDLHGNLSGPLSPELLEGELKAELFNLPILDKLSFESKLKQANLSGKIFNSNKSLSAQVSSQIVGNYLTKIQINTNKLEISKQKDQCSQLSLDGELSIPLSEPSSSRGKIDLKQISLGCPPYSLELKKGSRLNIENGNLNLGDIILDSTSGQLKISGALNVKTGLSVKAIGKSNLSAFLPFATSLDELSGDLSIDLEAKGPFKKPQISGALDLVNTRLEIESPQLQADRAKAHAILKNRSIELADFNGNLNGGKFAVIGSINLDNPTRSDLKLNFSNVLIAGSADAEFITSGQISLTDLERTEPTIRGEISIDSGQIEKKIDILKMARELSSKILGIGSRKIQINTSSQSSPVNLDLKIKAPSSLYLTSNFAQGEAKADLVVTGPAFYPKIQGKVEILEGWFGLRDRRFYIGSGKIIFNPEKSEPELEILAETTVFSRQGENVVIFATITGTTTSPQIKLDSDRGYNEREIVQLLTTGSDIRSTRRGTGVFSQDFNLEVPFVSDDSFFGLGRWLRRIAKIDALSIEPSFNSQSGVIEPALIAEKSIWPDLTLRGETSFGSAGNDARARLNYALSTRLTASGILDALSTQEKTALGFDVSYALKPQRSKLLNITVGGNIFLTTETILNFLKLNEDSRVELSTLKRLKESIINLYTDNGFPNSSAELKCTRMIDHNRCRNLEIEIEEGARVGVEDIKIQGDLLPEAQIKWLQSQQQNGQTATKLFRENIADGLLIQLRNEGYIRTRINSSYLKDTNPTTLLLEIQLGKPATFTFSGNNFFSDEVLLSTINLFGRRQPFGNNTINLLSTNIERLYHQNGFPYAKVSWTSPNEHQEERTLYYLHIEEGKKLSLSQIKFEGAIKHTESALRASVSLISPESEKSIFSPTQIIADQINENCKTLESILIYEGFEQAQVSFRLESDLNNNKADIVYEISEGSQLSYRTLIIDPLPEGLVFDAIERPYSEKKLEILVEDLEKLLISSGYRSAEVAILKDADKSEARIQIKAGPLCKIGQISFEGLEDISPLVVESKMTIKPGEAWNENEIANSRRALLRTGLFQKAEIKALRSDDICPQDAVVTLEERNLQSALVGAGVNSEYGLHLFSLMTDRSFFADGRSLSARIDAYVDQLNGEFSQGVMSFNYTDPDFLNPEIGFVSDLRFQRLEQNTFEFDLDRLSHAAYLHKNFDEQVSGSVGHTFIIENLEDVSPGAILDPDLDTGTVHISYLQGNMLLDYRDNPLNPRRGYAISINPQLSSEVIGSEANYFGMDLHANKIFSLAGNLEKFSLAYSTRLASAWTYSDTDFVPISQRYYLGGRTSVRGFRENSLGPKSEEGEVIGGDELFAQSLELRYLVIEDVNLQLFLDSGRLQLKDASYTGENMRYSWGLGTRYLSPIGPIGFDIGFPLNEKSGEPSTRFHFSIGANF